jgi:hypothetical protein
MVVDEDFKSRNPLSSEKHAMGPLSSSPSSTKKPFDWDLDPLTSTTPRKLKPFELDGKFNLTLDDSGDRTGVLQSGQGLRKFSWESDEGGEVGGLPKLSKLDPVVYPRENRL